jgi:hypothetical protein
MSEPINLADPAFEPTDEQLIGLSKRAFAGVSAAHERAMAKLRAQIADASAEAMRELDRRAVRTGT